MIINFSAQTSSNSLQGTIEGKLEKRSKGVFAPAGGKKMIVYIDDFNMPQKSVFGFMPPLELLKLWSDNGFWYDRGKQVGGGLSFVGVSSLTTTVFFVHIIYNRI